jgi:peptidyl-prolyl cis-trans isomerase SurA
MRALLLTLILLLPGAVLAQSPFSPVLTVNDAAITGFEIDQRRKMLELFRTPGNLDDLAVEQLIEDRLKSQELARQGLAITDEGLTSAMEDFASRANLTLDQFITVLNQNDVDQATLRDFVKVGVSWRDYVRSRFGSQTEISEAEIDAALGGASASDAGIEVLLTEIIIPAPPPQAAQALATAQRIAQLTSTAAFEAEARRVSALPSRTNGGRLDWLPITNYPAPLRPVILALAPGDVTAPIPITNGVALFQLRDVREAPVPALPPSALDYAAYTVASQAAAQAVKTQIDTCDDLYGLAQGQPPEVLDRQTLPPDQIAPDLALELAKLDADEVSTAVTRGNTVLVLMLCSRTPAVEGEVDRDAVRNQLRSQRLEGYSNGLLADLKAAATIVTQ